MTARVLLAAALLLLIAPRPAAACSKWHETPFELFEAAARVAEVRVVATPGRHKAGMAKLQVLRTLKGPARRELEGQETNTSCHVGYRTGRRALVFLGPRGETLGQYEGYLELKADDPLVVVLRAYAATREVDGRVAVLVDAIASGPAAVRNEAAVHLADRPELLARIGLPARERLLAAYAADPRDQPLLVVLARLGLDFVAPPRGPSPHWYAEMAALLRERDEELEELNAEGLAARIDAGQNGYDPTRIRALERCERLRELKLHPVLHYGRGVASHLWPKLAEACRTGEPFRW